MEHCQWSIKCELYFRRWKHKVYPCNYIDDYLLVKGNITIIGCNLVTGVTFKNCPPIIMCITNIDGTTLYDAEDLDFAMPMYNSLECSPNYSDTKGTL